MKKQQEEKEPLKKGLPDLSTIYQLVCFRSLPLIEAMENGTYTFEQLEEAFRTSRARAIRSLVDAGLCSPKPQDDLDKLDLTPAMHAAMLVAFGTNDIPAACESMMLQSALQELVDPDGSQPPLFMKWFADAFMAGIAFALEGGLHDVS